MRLRAQLLTLIFDHQIKFTGPALYCCNFPLLCAIPLSVTWTCNDKQYLYRPINPYRTNVENRVSS